MKMYFGIKYALTAELRFIFAGYAIIIMGNSLQKIKVAVMRPLSSLSFEQILFVIVKFSWP
jgi:hypothetical protein